MNYNIKVRECIDNKLIDFTLKNNISLYDLLSDFERRVRNIKSVYYHPEKHLSKIYFMAYRGVMNKYEVKK
jgi:hypothetical protein